MMKLVRSPDLPESVGYAATEKRYSVVLRAEVAIDGQDARVWVRVINISAGGLMIVAPMGTALDGRVTLAIRHIGQLAGRIVWAKSNCFGVKFDEAIDPQAVMSERARRAGEYARETQMLVANSSGVFAEHHDDEDVLPFVAMKRDNGHISRAA